MRIRISLVHYLNSAPLGWAFLHGPFQSRFEVIPSSPAKCADQLAAGEVEIGLIPSIEYQRISGLKVIPGISISSFGKVRSILLVQRLGAKGINSVALDTSSRTSVALMKILLREKIGIDPEFVPHPPDVEAMLQRCDAALLIGDTALRVRLDEFDTMDLAEAWVQWQRKPFVFAFWACRPNFAFPQDLDAIFQEAKDWGLRARKDIAAAYAGPLGLPASFLETYLFENIDYDMGPHHVEGLNSFYGLAKRERLIREHRPLRFISASESSLAGTGS